ncbi:MAG: RluA family pseudouridine synthase [Eubacteriales bacterium]
MDIPEILFEDNHVLVAVKPAGVLSQADITGAADMLTLLKKYLREKYNKPGDAYLGLLHRLDRPVTGVMVFAKTSKCAARISTQIRERRMDKRYQAIVRGVPDREEETLRSLIMKDEVKNQVVVIPIDSVDASLPNAREAVLIYKRKGTALREGPGGARSLALLEVQLITGRSHQIRAQLSDAGFPIVGDRKYGPDDNFYRGEICLEAFSLSFFHPVTGEKMTFELPISREDPWNLFENEYRTERKEYE